SSRATTAWARRSPRRSPTASAASPSSSSSAASCRRACATWCRGGRTSPRSPAPCAARCAAADAARSLPRLRPEHGDQDHRARVALGWLGLGATIAPRLGVLVARHRVAMACLAGYLVWITLSVAWASSPRAAAGDLWHWYAVALIFLVVATVARDAAAVRLIV